LPASGDNSVGVEHDVNTKPSTKPRARRIDFTDAFITDNQS
jgi:hypothetical protein